MSETTTIEIEVGDLVRIKSGAKLSNALCIEFQRERAIGIVENMTTTFDASGKKIICAGVEFSKPGIVSYRHFDVTELELCATAESPNTDYAQLQQAGSALEVQQAAVIKSLETRIDVLEAALTPFADAAGYDDALHTDSEHTHENLHTFDTLWETASSVWVDPNTPLTRAHLRAAAEALKAGKP